MPDYTSRYYVATLRFSYLGRRASVRKREREREKSFSSPLSLHDLSISRTNERSRSTSPFVFRLAKQTRSSVLAPRLRHLLSFVYRGRQYRKFPRNFDATDKRTHGARVHRPRDFRSPRAINAIAPWLLLRDSSLGCTSGGIAS